MKKRNGVIQTAGKRQNHISGSFRSHNKLRFCERRIALSRTSFGSLCRIASGVCSVLQTQIGVADQTDIIVIDPDFCADVGDEAEERDLAAVQITRSGTVVEAA